MRFGVGLRLIVGATDGKLIVGGAEGKPSDVNPSCGGASVPGSRDTCVLGTGLNC